VHENVLWADLHNHNAIGYGRGSIERAMEIARSHLDVVAVTPHAAWPDMPAIEGGRQDKWLRGFETVRANWPRVRRLVAEANRPGAFVAILGYEWHSSRCGDYCLLYPGDEGDLVLPDTIEALQAHARAAGALLIPHHLGYATGHRGADFDRLADDVTPVVEVYSEHGGCERDRDPFEMYRHSMGGRSTANTLQSLLARGARVGVTAGTDDHLGYPGAYREGLTAILAAERTREAVFEALRARRCYGVTGDRIRLAFHINGQAMGSELPAQRERRIEVAVDAPDELDRVEVLRNNRVIRRWFPDDAPATAADLSEPVRCRVEFGWGPWTDLDLGRVADWRITARVEGGRLLDVQPCFQSGPFDEERRNRILERSDAHCVWVSYTSRREAFDGIPTNAVILTLSGTPEARLALDIEQPAAGTVSAALGDLLVRNTIHFTGPFPAESLTIHRLVPQRRAEARVAFDDRTSAPEPGSAKRTDCYTVRVTESNGQTAWSSPIWVGGSSQRSAISNQQSAISDQP